MVGINVGTPMPASVFPFSGYKQSFFGDLHCNGRDGVAFFTEAKCVTTHWFDEEAKEETRVDTWEGKTARK
jgi:malonate-semialdehyde dehydrogenase (acetylating)/methylmalonate-semialdehyde dehydrogenase